MKSIATLGKGREFCTLPKGREYCVVSKGREVLSIGEPRVGTTYGDLATYTYADLDMTYNRVDWLV